MDSSTGSSSITPRADILLFILLKIRKTLKGMNRIVLIALAAAPIAHAQIPALTPDELSQVRKVDTLTVPGPGEFFSAMDAAGEPAWGQHLREGAPPVTGSRAAIALLIGNYVADGYVAVEAHDGQAVKNIGKEIIALAKRLNVSQSVLGRANSINDFADKEDWSALREELEATQNEVKLDMAEQKDEQLVTLVTTGAWIRGVDLVSGIIEENYTPEAARILRQPAIIEYLIDELDDLPERTREKPEVRQVLDGLRNCLPLVTEATPSPQQVAALHREMGALVSILMSPESTPTP